MKTGVELSEQAFTAKVRKAVWFLGNGLWLTDGETVEIKDLHSKHLENAIKYFIKKRLDSPNSVCIPYFIRELERRGVPFEMNPESIGYTIIKHSGIANKTIRLNNSYESLAEIDSFLRDFK